MKTQLPKQITLLLTKKIKNLIKGPGKQTPIKFWVLHGNV